MNKTEESVYTLENVPLFEAIYGESLISLGDTTAIENMFSDIDLAGLKLLDVGFGLGGVACYLAKTKNIEVMGVEIHQWMADYAKKHTPKEVAHLLNFYAYDQTANLPFEKGSFDLVYSKGVFNHIKDKKHLFSEINRVLKPSGKIVIADWIHAALKVDDSSPLVNETKISYETILTNSGFGNIAFRDDSQLFLTYVNNLLANLEVKKEFIEEKYGKYLFDVILQDHKKLIEEINQKNKFAVRITANKLY